VEFYYATPSANRKREIRAAPPHSDAPHADAPYTDAPYTDAPRTHFKTTDAGVGQFAHQTDAGAAINILHRIGDAQIGEPGESEFPLDQRSRNDADDFAASFRVAPSPIRKAAPKTHGLGPRIFFSRFVLY
jgi:hypothetical protein